MDSGIRKALSKKSRGIQSKGVETQPPVQSQAQPAGIAQPAQPPPDPQDIPAQHARSKAASVFFGLLLVVVVLAVLIIVFIVRSDEEFEGSLEAFCVLLDDDSATSEGEPNYEALVEVAPKEIRPSVQKLQDTSKEISVLEQSDDLAAYFAAAFDRGAVQARRDLDSYAFRECDIEVSEFVMRQDIRDYINERFANPSWAVSAELDLTVVDGVLHGLSVKLAESGSGQSDPNNETAIAACRAYDEYLSDHLVPGPLEVSQDQTGEVVTVGTPDRNTACE